MKKYRSIYLMFYDLIIVLLSYTFALFVRLDFNVNETINYTGFYQNLIVVLFVYFIVFKILKLDKSIWSKVSIDEGMRIIVGNLLGAFTIIVFTILIKRGIPLSVTFIAFLLNTLAQEGARFSYRIYRLMTFKNKVSKIKDSKRYLIYGAGDSGVMILREILNNSNYSGYVVGFIDDNPVLKNKTILGAPVFGDSSNLKQVISQ